MILAREVPEEAKHRFPIKDRRQAMEEVYNLKIDLVLPFMGGKMPNIKKEIYNGTHTSVEGMAEIIVNFEKKYPHLIRIRIDKKDET